MFVLGIGSLIVCFARFGWRVGTGFALGAGVSCLNFYWLKKLVAGLADSTSGRASGRLLIQRFLLRYILMGLVAFAILAVSRESLYGLLAGLFLPATALLCEAVYEIYVTLIRGV